MRLLHVVAPAGVGGLERVVQTLTAAQREAAHDVHVAAVVGGLNAEAEAQFSDPLLEAGVTLHRIDLPGRAYSRERAAIAAIAGSLKSEIVHTHGYRPDVVDGGAARSTGAASVTTVHGFTGGGIRNRLYEWLQRRSFRRIDAVVAVSLPLKRQLEADGIAREKLHLVVNAWRPFGTLLDRAAARSELGLSAEGATIGWVGRISREKGLDVLLDAVASMGDSAPRVAVVGDGPERQALELQHAARRDAGQLVWCGTVRDAARVLCAFDALVISSRTEGTPMVVFEAMAAGVPLVATRVGGIPDMVTDAEASLVVSGDIAALSRAIRGTINQPDAAGERARLAQARLERHTNARAWADRYSEVYHAALQRRSSR